MSTSGTQARAAKKRPYRLGRREERLEQTRQRIVEAAVELHSTIGPARTTVADIARRAGVQRHTYYAHFPDERSLFLACSGLALQRNPLPDVEAWRDVRPGRERLRRGLGEIYGWYERNAQQTACVLRDAEQHAPTREIVEIRMRPTFERAAELLGEGLNERQRTLVALALDFSCWRILSGNPAAGDPAELMSAAVAGLAA